MNVQQDVQKLVENLQYKNKMEMNRTAYFFLRLPIAVSLLGHGLVRLHKLKGFSHWMVTLMENSYLPKTMIAGFSYLVPFVEVATGLLLLLGLFTRQVIYTALALMALFIFGNTTIENRDPINVQLVHAAYLGGLLYLIRDDAGWQDVFPKKRLEELSNKD